MRQNLLTYKFKYTCESSLLDYIRQYNNVLRYTYNRLLENPKMKTKDVTASQKHINNCDLIGSHLKNSAMYAARSIIARGSNKVIFGGKSLFLQRCQKKISASEYRIGKLIPLYSVGETNNYANRLFRIIDKTTIEFRPDRNHHYKLYLQSVGNARYKELTKLMSLQNTKQIAITYGLDLDYIYLTFDYNALKTYTYTTVQNRVIAIDMNPNSIGWSIVDWSDDVKYHIVKSGTFSIKLLNDFRNSKSVASDNNFHRYVTNKRKYEVIEIAKQLFVLCRHYHCEVFAIEDLNIPTKDIGRGRNYNRLVNNNWCRDLLVQQLQKHIYASSTQLVEVQPQYNSYIGNLVFRYEHLPDECLASIEIGRRGFEFSTQYIFNRRLHNKTVVFPNLKSVKNQLVISLEELDIDVPDFDDWKTILSAVKESKKKYRFSTSDAQMWHQDGLFSKIYKQKYIIVNVYV